MPDFFIGLRGEGGGGRDQRRLRTTALEHPFIQTQWKI